MVVEFCLFQWQQEEVPWLFSLSLFITVIARQNPLAPSLSLFNPAIAGQSPVALFCLSSHACIPGASAFMTNCRKMGWTKFPLSRQLLAKVTKESLWVMKKLRKVTLYNYLWPRRLNYKLHMQRYCLKHQKLWENYSDWPMDNVYIRFI